MIDPTAKLSLGRQADVLGISRGSVNDKLRPVSDADLRLMHRIDKLHMEFPLRAAGCCGGCWSGKVSRSGGCALPR